MEKESNNLKIFNFSKYRILNNQYIDRVNKYNIKYKAFEFPGLEADNLIYFLSQRALERKIPSAIYAIDADLVGDTNKYVCFSPPVNTSENKKQKRLNHLKDIALRAKENKISRHQSAILSELYFSSHNNIKSYLEDGDKSISFEIFSKEITNQDEPSTILKGEDFRKYYNSLMLKDFDTSQIISILEDVYGWQRKSWFYGKDY